MQRLILLVFAISHMEGTSTVVIVVPGPWWRHAPEHVTSGTFGRACISSVRTHHICERCSRRIFIEATLGNEARAYVILDKHRTPRPVAPRLLQQPL